ncbi:MAG TPA: SdrD B-like domain-containing protein, partial [Gemmataceae bacterium]|nr:SdrD B-like domain-containing protein [Gemmataceae bacterium]
GTVQMTESGTASSFAAGGGNLVASLVSSGDATVTVVYNYIPANGLKPGNYTIHLNPQPANFLPGKESVNNVVLNVPPGTNVIPVTLANTDLPNNDFGELTPASVSGFVYLDANNNGIKDANENGIPGVQVTLSGTNDLGATVSQTVTTDSSGFYSFGNLRPGTYSVTETPPANYLQGKNSIGSLGGTLSNSQMSGIVLGSGSQGANYDFAHVVPASLSGYVYLDANNNGVKDQGENGLPGVQITLSGTNDLGSPVSQTVTSDPSGFFQFTNLRPGTYSITETPPANYLDGKDAIGSLGGVLGKDQMTNILLASGNAGTNYDFAELASASLSGSVFMDTNNDGIKEAGENGIAGVQVTLTGTNDLGNAVSQTVNTDANGAYQFNNLRPGTYALSETQPANYLQGKNSIGSQGGQSGNDMFTNLVLAQGTQGSNNNFGELTPASLAGFVYVDTNNDGIKEPGESGIGGVQIALTGSNDLGAVNQTVQTDASGAYKFANLRPGNYTLTETPPVGYRDGKDAIGSQGGTVGIDTLSNIVLGVGIVGTDNDFAELQILKSDLSIVKTANQASVQVGTNLSYTLTVSNLGPNAAQNVMVTDTLPAGTTYVSGFSPGWTITQSGGIVTATTASLPAGLTQTIIITVTAPPVAGNITNTATVSSDTPDPNPGNNTSSVTTTVFSQPGQVILKTITPLVTTPAIVSKIQMTWGNKALNPTLLGELTLVDGLYRTLLGRPATYTEQVSGVQKLQSGVTQAQLVSILIATPAHQAVEVRNIYQTILHRAPTAGELSAGVNMLLAGNPESTLMLNLLTSPQYQALHPTASSFISGFYLDVLSQIPDSQTQLNLVQSLGTETVAAMAQDLLNSTAAFNAMVTDGFVRILRRYPTANEMQYWTNLLQTRQITQASFQAQLASSQEFYTLARNSMIG